MATQAFRRPTDGAGLARPGVDWQASPSPFRLAFTSAGRPLTAELLAQAGASGRLGYALDDGTLHATTDLVASEVVPDGTRYTLATDERARRATVTVTHTPLGLEVDVRLVPDTGVARVFEALSAAPDEHFLGAGEQRRFVDLRGHVVPMEVAYDCGSEFPTPFFSSSAGYAVFVPTLRLGRFAFPGADAADGTCTAGGGPPPCPISPRADGTVFCFEGDSLAYQIFAGSPAQLLAAYTAEAGRPAPAPPIQFGAEKWRGSWAESSESFLRLDVAKYSQLGIPLTWIQISDPWEVGICWGTMRFDPVRFPDPEGLISSLRAAGLHVMIWISPLVVESANCPSNGYSPADVIGSDARSSELDLTDRAAVSLFEQKIRDIVALGIEGVKGDRGDEQSLLDLTLHGGSGRLFQDAYPLIFAQAVTTALRSVWGRNFATIFRAGTLGSQARLPGIWLGDDSGTWDGLRQMIWSGLSASASGYPVWGSDIGGYTEYGTPLTPELFVRWAQFGAVSPVFEVGGLGTSSHFWDFGPETVDLFRQAAVLHYELVPYLYDLSRRASATGVPIVRPLGFEYPSDPGSWSSDLELTIGSSLLAAPVVQPGSSARVYLPPGSAWLDLFSGRRVPGGVTLTRATPLSEFPLYLRAGAAIPFNLREPEVWSEPWALNDLIRNGRSGWMVAPGAAASSTSGVGGTITTRLRGKTLDIELARSPKQVQVLVLTSRLPESVAIDGRPVAGPRTASVLRSERQGWAARPLPFGGVLLKLTPQTGAATARVVLR